jgi:hypothetical protein
MFKLILKLASALILAATIWSSIAADRKPISIQQRFEDALQDMPTDLAEATGLLSELSEYGKIAFNIVRRRLAIVIEPGSVCFRV